MDHVLVSKKFGQVLLPKPAAGRSSRRGRSAARAKDKKDAKARQAKRDAYSIVAAVPTAATSSTRADGIPDGVDALLHVMVSCGPAYARAVHTPHAFQ